jgi:hypothetical protein
MQQRRLFHLGRYLCAEGSPAICWLPGLQVRCGASEMSSGWFVSACTGQRTLNRTTLLHILPTCMMLHIPSVLALCCTIVARTRVVRMPQCLLVFPCESTQYPFTVTNCGWARNGQHPHAASDCGWTQPPCFQAFGVAPIAKVGGNAGGRKVRSKLIWLDRCLFASLL